MALTATANRQKSFVLYAAVCCITCAAFGIPAACQEAEPVKTITPPKTAAELVICLQDAGQAIHDYTVNGETDSGGKKQRFKVLFKRPNLVRIDAGEGQVSVQPNGDIRGRLGRGLFGSISQRLDRNDKRLKDAEGIPFYSSDFASMFIRINDQIQHGATATMTSDATDYYLEVKSGDTVWKYTINKADYRLLENSRWVQGNQVEDTHYTNYKPNTGLSTSLFHF